MDGRRFRKWWLSGCLLVGALGCNRNAVQAPGIKPDDCPTGHRHPDDDGARSRSGADRATSRSPPVKSCPNRPARVRPKPRRSSRSRTCNSSRHSTRRHRRPAAKALLDSARARLPEGTSTGTQEQGRAARVWRSTTSDSASARRPSRCTRSTSRSTRRTRTWRTRWRWRTPSGRTGPGQWRGASSH